MNIVENLLSGADNEGCGDDLTVVYREALEALRDATPVTFLELALEGLKKDFRRSVTGTRESYNLGNALEAVETALKYLGVFPDSI